jgi:type II secretory pathway component GspD/PulD (secretin)
MAAASEFAFGTLDFTALQAILDFIKSDSKSRLLASPRVITMNNKQAEINVGKARPIPNFEYNSDTAEYQITGFTEKTEGVVLTVTPQISKVDGESYTIRLKLRPKVTTYNNENVLFGGSLTFNYPLLSERYADTEVIIKDGQTIVIGGLIESRKTENVTKVPVLGDLPFLGRLFSYKNVDPNEQTELLIFVTARVLPDLNEPLIGYKSDLITEPPRPFKADLRDVGKR